MELKVIRHGIPCLLILVATILVYARVGDYGFMLIDDGQYVHENAMVQKGVTLEGFHWALTEFYAGNWHPLTWLSHMLDVTLFGSLPGPMHVVNAGLHALNGALLYWLTFQLLRSFMASLVVALIFTVHPLHVESVVWISERKDVLCAFFYLLSLISYLYYSEKPCVFRYLVVAFTLTLALLAKPMAVSLAVIFCLLDWLILRRFRPALRLHPSNVKVLLEKLPFIGITLASIAATLVAQSGAIVSVEMIPFQDRFMNAIVAYATYLGDAFIPLNLVPFYPFQHPELWNSFAPAFAIMIIITSFSIALRNRFHWFLFGWLWFLLTLLPVIGLVQVGNQSHADRYMYIPSIGLLIIVATVVLNISGKKLLVSVLITSSLIFYSALGWIQVGYWSNPHLLWSRALQLTGDRNHYALLGLANHFLTIRQYERAEEAAVKLISIRPDLYQGFLVLGMIELARQEFSDAEYAFREALRRNNNNVSIINNLAVSIERQGSIGDAINLYRRAHEIDPYHPSPNANLKRLEKKVKFQ